MQHLTFLYNLRVHNPDGGSDDATLATQELRERSMPLDRFRLVFSTVKGLSTVELNKRHVVIGRSSGVDVVVDDPSVSRRHAGLELGDPVTLCDLGSRHGTRVPGRELAEETPVVIHPGTAFEIGEVTVLLERARVERAANAGKATVPEDGVVVMAPPMRRLWKLLEVVGPSDLNVLLLGETGTGKEVFAQAVVASSSRRGEPFVKVNCAALSPTLLESELFGHERGAFTGADRAKAGLIEVADGGTLFLDELGELPLEIQAKLLRAVELGEVLRVGATRPKRVDVRYIGATNIDLEEAVASRTFRADLLFRLNGFTLRLPPLRERREEVVPLAEWFLRQAAHRRGKAAPTMDAAVREALMRHAFPGNVRQLKAIVERALALSRGAAVLTVEHLLLDDEGREEVEEATGPADLKETLEDAERRRIVEALASTGGNQREAARRLGIARRTLINKIEKYGLPRPRKKP